MPELRKDYVTDTWVVFSTVRSKRPEEFRAPGKKTPAEKCPFCPGHEHMTPPEILAYRKDGPKNGAGWWIRCVPNKYPALEAEGEVHRRVRQLFHSVNGVGAHEVIVETPEHDATMNELSDFQVQEIITAYKQRYHDLTKDKRFKYILIFKNHGEKAGASQTHPHSQLIATPIVPRRIMEEVTAATRHYQATGGSCILGDIVETEHEGEQRVHPRRETFIAISSPAGPCPFETWGLPKAHELAFEDITDEERTPFSRILKDILGRLRG